LALFDSTFKPPAPVAEVVVSHPVTHITSDLLLGKLDTGADMTILPKSVIEVLGLESRSSIMARGFDGRVSRMSVYYVRLVVETYVLDGVRCIASERTNVLLGRNVLNQFFLILDGPGRRVEIRQADD
jgi:predicted aspartyl protease